MKTKFIVDTTCAPKPQKQKESDKFTEERKKKWEEKEESEQGGWSKQEQNVKLTMRFVTMYPLASFTLLRQKINVCLFYDSNPLLVLWIAHVMFHENFVWTRIFGDGKIHFGPFAMGRWDKYHLKWNF